MIMNFVFLISLQICVMIQNDRFIKIIKETWQIIQETPIEVLTKQAESGKMRDVWKILYAIWRQRRKKVK